MSENKKFYHPANLDSPNYGRCLRTARERQMFNPDADFTERSDNWRTEAMVEGSILIACAIVFLYAWEAFS
jgi:hypothetical protein